MDRRIRQVAGMLTALLVAVAGMAGWIQGVRADRIAAYEPANPRNPSERARNPFHLYEECTYERGLIVSLDGQELARSAPVSGRRCRFERTYPNGDLAPHVVGQWSLHYPKTGLEAVYNQELVGEPPPPRSLNDLLTGLEPVGSTLVTTLDSRLQRTALEALGGRRGGVVALNPKTGAVLVAASIPTYDPNPLASNDRAAAEAARCALGVGGGCSDPQTPLVSVALQSRRPPGSSFKVVTAAAALESGEYEPSTRVPSAASYRPSSSGPPIGNYGGGSCGGTLARSLTVSCNTAFARIAVDIGADQLLATARAMNLDQFGGSAALELSGCDARPVTDIDSTRTGCLPSELVEQDATGEVVRRERLTSADFLARAGFGQWVLQVSPLGMAIVAGTVANGGSVPRPRFADRVIDPPERGGAAHQVRTGVGAAAISPSTAEKLTEMMRSVVTSGTGRSAFGGFPIPVAGKTGTAQQPSCPSSEQAIFGRRCGDLPHAWFIAFAPVGDPTIAIAVLVERGGGNNEEATGGRVAAPVARKVLERYFELYPAPSR